MVNDKIVQLRKQGIELCEQKQFVQALKCFEEAIVLDPTNAASWNSKGCVFIELGRPNEAIECYEQSIELDPKFAIPWHGKGNALRKLGRPNEAIECYDQCIELSPKLAGPWFAKSFLFIDIYQYQDAQSCLIRTYYLKNNKYFFNKFKVFLDPFDKSLNAPLFVYRIYTDHPELQLHLKYASLRERTFETVGPILKVLNFLESKTCKFEPIKKLKIKGLLNFYMNDPIIAGSIFNEIDTLDETDLLSQYYLTESLEAYCEPIKGERKVALENAIDYRGGDELQLYYAAHIFLREDKTDEAYNLFKKSNTFLPSLYMQMLTTHKLSNIDERNELIKSILHQEEILTLEGSRGYVGEAFHYEIDIEHPEWSFPIQKYAYHMEIIEAVQLLHDVADTDTEIKMRSILDKVGFSYTKNINKKSYDMWILKEQSIVKLEEYSEKIKREQLELAAAKLKNYFLDSVINNINQNNAETELAKLIDNGNVAFNHKIYHLLIEYFCYNKMLSAEHTILFSFYISHKEHINNTNASFTELAASTAISTLIGTSISKDPYTATTLATLGAVLGVKLLRYFKPKGKKNIRPYADYKKSFIKFARKKEKEEEVYPVNDFNNLLDDLEA